MYEQTYSVAEFTALVGRAVARAFPDQIWLRGEIRDITRPTSGHVFFTLAEPGGDASARASVPVTLFASDRLAVNRVLLRSGAVRMTDGVEVRIRGVVGFYAAKGTVQLRMTWIDTDYTLSRLAAERERLVRQLAIEGLLDRNRSRPVPPVPLRVGLVTSRGSAAHADFLHELEVSGYGWEVFDADARVQGVDAEATLVAGLEAVTGAGVDVICIVRGGGAQTDLAAFDGEPVARAIAACPVPVFTGIGHETDSTLADRVAHMSYKTPTACAAALVDVVSGFEDRVGAARERIAAVARHSIDQWTRSLNAISRRTGLSARARLRLTSHRLDTVTRGLRRASRQSFVVADRRVRADARRVVLASRTGLGSASARVRALDDRLRHGGPRSIVEASARLDALVTRVAGSDPRRILARGWTITLGEDGRAVRSAGEVSPGDAVTTRFADGTVRSRVEAIDLSTVDGGG